MSKKNSNKNIILIIVGIVIFVVLLILILRTGSPSGKNATNTQSSSGNINNQSSNIAPVVAFINSNNRFVNIGGESKQPQVLFTIEAGCASCAVLTQEFSKISPLYGSVKFYGVDINSADTYSELMPWINTITNGKGRVSYVISKSNTFLEDYKVTNIDTVYIINKNGDLVYSKVLPSESSLIKVLSTIS